MKDLARFQKVHEDDHVAVLKHPHGHQIRIAKKGLSSEMRGELSKLPLHMVDGGMIPKLKIPELGMDLDQDSSYEPHDDMTQNASQMPEPEPQAYQEPPPQPSSANQMGQALRDGVSGAMDTIAPAANAAMQLSPYYQASQFAKGLAGVSNAPSAAAPQPAQDQPKPLSGPNLGEAPTAQAAPAPDPMEALNHFTKKFYGEYNAALNDFKKGHIDPNQYVNNQSTGQKIATAIGLVLGGIGGGITHQENPALKFLNSQIENNIKGQMAVMDKKATMLGFYQKMFGEMPDALKMTMALQYGMLAHKFSDAASKTRDPMAQQRALQAFNMFDIKGKSILNGLVQSHAMNQMDPAVQIANQVPEKRQDKTFEELKNSENLGNIREDIKEAFQSADEKNTMGQRILHFGYRPASVARLKTLVMPLLKDNAGRVNETELERIDELIPAPFDGPEKVKEKYRGMMEFVNSKMSHPYLRAYGIKEKVAPSKREHKTGKKH